MSHNDDYEADLSGDREDIAAVLSDVVDGILAGRIRLGDGHDAITVDVPGDLSLDIELETEADEVSLELEMEWPTPDDTAAVTLLDVEDEEDEPEVEREEPTLAGAADATQSLARFEVFRDQAEEWRWRLRHRNGNIIATSGEGYTRKHNAMNGLRSVIENSPDAEITEDAAN